MTTQFINESSKTKFIGCDSDIKTGDKVVFTEQFNSRCIWDVASVRKDSYGRLYIGIQRTTEIVEYPCTNFVQVI